MVATGAPTWNHELNPRLPDRTFDYRMSFGTLFPLDSIWFGHTSPSAVWRHDYNTVRPHSALDGGPPTLARCAVALSEGSAQGAHAHQSTLRCTDQGLS